MVGSTSYDCPILALFYGPVDIAEDGCGDVGVPESVYVGFGDADEDVLGGTGSVGSFGEGGAPRAEMDMNGEPDQKCDLIAAYCLMRLCSRGTEVFQRPCLEQRRDCDMENWLGSLCPLSVQMFLGTA